MKTSIAVYPGTFDPLTNGHIDIALRAAKVFPHLVLAISETSSIQKQPLFSINERIEMANEIFKNQNISVQSYQGLLVDFMQTIDARVIVRGIRTMSDYEYEFQLAHINRHLNASIETLFLTTSPDYAFVSSSMLKEAYRLGGDITNLVPSTVLNALQHKIHG